jgi:hypothetical protein
MRLPLLTWIMAMLRLEGRDILIRQRKYINITWRYQLHPAFATTQLSKDTTDAHTKKLKKEKSTATMIYSFVAAVQTSLAKTTPKVQFSKSDFFKKETKHKHRSRPIIDHRFSPMKKAHALETMSSTRPLSGTTN